MIFGCKFNYLSYLVWYLVMIFGWKCNYVGYVVWNLVVIFCQMFGKFVIESYIRFFLKVLVNSFYCFEYEKELVVCGFSVICNVEEDLKIEII